MKPIDLHQNLVISTQISQFEKMRVTFLAGLEVTDKTAISATDCLRLIKLNIKKIIEERKKITVPMDEAKRAVMEQAKKMLKPLEYERDSLDSKLTIYTVEKQRLEDERMRMEKEVEEKRLKAMRDEQIEQAEMSESDLALEDAIATQEQLDNLEKQEVKSTGIVKGDISSSSLMEIWHFRVVDISKVPIEWLIVNEVAVNGAIKNKNGLRNIPGLEIYSEHKLRTSRRGQ